MNSSAHKLNKKYFDVLFTFDEIRVLLVKSISPRSEAYTIGHATNSFSLINFWKAALRVTIQSYE